MKKIFLIALLGCIISSCSNDKAQETALLNDVIKTHDKLMADDGAVMKNRTLLKSIAKTDTSAGVKDSVILYSAMLDNADNMMMNWMNKFNPDFTGKTHEQIMSYLNTQKVQILQLDSQINTALSTSDNYIKKVKVK